MQKKERQARQGVGQKMPHSLAVEVRNAQDSKSPVDEKQVVTSPHILVVRHQHVEVQQSRRAANYEIEHETCKLVLSESLDKG